MRKIFHAIKCIQNSRIFRRTLYSVDNKADNNFLANERTYPPISKVLSLTRSSTPGLVPVNTHDNLLNGYTKENCEINVNTKHIYFNLYSKICTSKNK